MLTKTAAIKREIATLRRRLAKELDKKFPAVSRVTDLRVTLEVLRGDLAHAQEAA